MAWIESHDTLNDHPKVYELCTTLNGDKATIIGVLHLLWHFTLKFSWRDGDLSKFSKEAICSAIDWKGDANTLFEALHKCGWLDDMRVHDWIHYAGKIVTDRIYNEKRKRRKTPKNGVSSRKIGATLPYPTLPNHTLPKREEGKRSPKPNSPEEVTEYAKSIGFGLDGHKFWNYYESKGWLIGKSPMKDWKAAVRTWKSNGYEGGASANGSKPISEYERDRQRFIRDTRGSLLQDKVG